MTEQYDNNAIHSLTDKEAVRLRPATYFGSDDARGAFYSFVEILDNSIDEYKAGYGNKIIIKKHKNNSLEIQDFGRGLPVDFNSSEQRYNWELVCCTLNAGGKYSSKNYKFSKGLNGLGLSVSQFASEYMNIEVTRDGHKYNLHFEHGENINGLQKEKYPSTSTGTIIKWIPDLQVFTDNKINNNDILDILKKQAIVNKGLKLIFINECVDTQREFYYENGIVDYIKEIHQDKNISNVQYWETTAKGRDREDKDDYNIELQLTFCFSNELSHLEFYHNSSLLEDDGSPQKAIQKGFINVIDKYLKDNKLYKKKEKISYEDIIDSLILISNTYSEETSYEHQTKKAITNKFIKDYMTQWVEEQLTIYFTENPLETTKIINQCLINMRANKQAQQSKLNLKKKLQNKSNGLSIKLQGVKHCDFRNSTLEERIFLVDEGISANSTIEDSIDGRIMGCCGLRGRFINSLKASIKDVFKNEPALRLVQALGCGVVIPPLEKKKYKGIELFDQSKLNYGSLGILCDADEWGHGINLSIITFCYKFFTPLLKQGRIYLVRSPRYEIVTKNDTFYLYNEKEKNDKILELQHQHIVYDVSIKKGLGEFSKEDFWTYVLSPEARKKTFIQIQYSPIFEQQINKCFNTFMGEDILSRKNFIKNNITNINLSTIE